MDSSQFLPQFLMGSSSTSSAFVQVPAPSAGLSEPVSPDNCYPLPLVPVPRISGPPPTVSIYDDVIYRKARKKLIRMQRYNYFPVQSPLSTRLLSTPGTNTSMLPPPSAPDAPLSPPGVQQMHPFYTQGESLSSEDQLDSTWVTVFGFAPGYSSYVYLQFAQYGNILNKKMEPPGNWMHLQYQTKLQARKALAKHGKVFGCTMVGVKPYKDKDSA